MRNSVSKKRRGIMKLQKVFYEGYEKGDTRYMLHLIYDKTCIDHYNDAE
jgi:hypothetical protein